MLGPITHDRHAVLPDGRVLSARKHDNQGNHSSTDDPESESALSQGTHAGGSPAVIHVHPRFRIVMVGDGPALAPPAADTSSAEKLE